MPNLNIKRLFPKEKEVMSLLVLIKVRELYVFETCVMPLTRIWSSSQTVDGEKQEIADSHSLILFTEKETFKS